MLKFKSLVLDDTAVSRALRRISFEIVEKNRGIENVCIVGICRRGVPIAEIIAENIAKIENQNIPVGKLDITFYRDDIVVKNSKDPVINSTDIGFDISGKHVILVDDVLYTGRTVRAAIDALITVGRPASVQLAILCDRGHRELPIRADYVGKNLPTSRNERVLVKIQPFDDKTCVELHENIEE